MTKLTLFIRAFLLHSMALYGLAMPIFAQEAQSTKSNLNGAASEAILPAAWIGVWRGEVSVENAQGKQPGFQMELAVEPIASSSRCTWRITYEGQAGKSVRQYEIELIDRQQGHYRIDEKNSIQIDATLLGNLLLSHFTVLNQTIVTRYQIEPTSADEMTFELTTASLDSTTTTGGQGDIPQVTSLKYSNRQIARLKRVAKPSLSEEKRNSIEYAWKRLNTEPYRGKQDDVYFVNPTTGWYGNGAGKIFKTSDGGETWQLQLESPGTYFRCLAFIDDQRGFAGNIGPGYFPNVTDKQPLYQTHDGGATWKPVTTIDGPPVVGLCAMQVLREEYINAGVLDNRIRLIGVGRVGGPVAMITSDDAGATWQQTDISMHAAMAFDVHFINRNVGFIAAATDADVTKSHALILRTEDGGKTWNKVYQSKRPYELTWKIAFPSEEVGYVTIQSYNPDTSVNERFVAKTIDGGKAWTEVPLVTDASVRQFGIAFLNERIGWVGAVPHGFFTRDGGANWEKADIGNAVNKIRLLSNEQGTVGFAIGTNVYRLDTP